MIDGPNVVRNAGLLFEHFGRWPSFHDAEVLNLQLDRNGPTLSILVRVATISAEVDSRGYLSRPDEADVLLTFTGAEDIDLRDFNNQNVLWQIDFAQTSNGLSVTLHATYGLGGSFRCESAEVRSVTPVAS